MFFCLRFSIREFWREKKSLSLGFISLIVGITAISLVSSTVDSVKSFVDSNSQSFLSGDIQIRSESPYTNKLKSYLENLDQNEVERADMIETNTVISVKKPEDTEENNSLLVSLKAVSDTYPLYGTLELEAPDPYQGLSASEALVDQGILDRLDTTLGEKISIGGAEFIIKAVIKKEPDRSLNPFQFGERVMISKLGLSNTGLTEGLGQFEYKTSLKLSDINQTKQISEGLQEASLSDNGYRTARVRDYKQGPDRIARILQVVERYFLTITVITVFLVILVAQMNLNAYVLRQQKVIAIWKCVGMKNSTLLFIFSLVFLFISVSSAFIGHGLGAVIQFFALPYFARLVGIPVNAQLSFSGWEVSLLIALIMSFIAGIIPLFRLKNIRPRSIFQKNLQSSTALSSRLSTSALSFIAMILMLVLIWVLTASWTVAGYAISGIILSFLLLYALFSLFLWSLKKLKPWFSSFFIRSAISFLHEPGSPARFVLSALSLALSALFITLLMRSTIVNGLELEVASEATPELIIIDVQTDQVEGVKEILPGDVELFPVVRARIESIDGVKIDRENPDLPRDIWREFNVTYRDNLIKGESIASGTFWESNTNQAELSVSEEEALVYGIELGSEVVFNVQGVPISTTVSNLRKLKREGISPFFYFLVPQKLLKNAPQSFFGFLQVEPEKVSSLQKEITVSFPNVSTIPTDEIVSTLRRFTTSISQAVLLVTGSAFVSGMLMLVALLYNTALQRKKDFMLMKIIGADKPFLWKIYASEIVFFLLCSVVVGLVFSFVVVSILNTFYLEFPELVWNSDIFWVFTLAIFCDLCAGFIIMQQTFNEPAKKL